MRLNSYKEIKAYYQGKKHGVWLFAWWKDGVQYVGTCGTTYVSAIAALVRLENEAMQTFSDGREVWTN